MSIPGTHDSCAKYGPSIVKCQQLNISDQLTRGIRFFDIRCRKDHGSSDFPIHHGPYYQHITLAGVLNQCYTFLDAHPDETILMRIKQEYSHVSDWEFIDVFDRLNRSRMYVDRAIPKLGDVRGRIVIIANVEGLAGIPYGSLNIQDEWKVRDTQESKNRKVRLVREHLQLAADAHADGSQQMFLNFASGGSYTLPSRVANWVNPRIERAIEYCQFDDDEQDNSTTTTITTITTTATVYKCYYGIVAMDYPHRALINHIIRQNNNVSTNIDNNYYSTLSPFNHYSSI
jgi:1-phosphatidylinositol phosphodiesterase